MDDNKWMTVKGMRRAACRTVDIHSLAPAVVSGLHDVDNFVLAQEEVVRLHRRELVQGAVLLRDLLLQDINDVLVKHESGRRR